MTHLDLFSGIGGFALVAQRAGFTTIGFSEIEPYACKILAEKFGAFMANPDGTRKPQPLGSVEEIRRWVVNGGESGTVPNVGDIRAMRGMPCDLITGGFPCQPYSLAGKRGGAGDDRALWPEMLRVIAESKPRWVLGENVPGIINMELDNLLSDLEGIGYSAWPIVIPACAVDARHRRDRVWIVANSSERRRGEPGERQGEQPGGAKTISSGETVAHSNSANGRRAEQSLQSSRDTGGQKSGASIAGDGKNVANTNGHDQHRRPGDVQMGRGGRESETEKDGAAGSAKWCPEPELGRVAHGIPNRAHRLKGLGNAIVPQVAEIILREMAKTF